jgi:hypothetical protein
MIKHNWVKTDRNIHLEQICVQCGIIKKRVIRKKLMAIINHPPWEAYTTEFIWVYLDNKNKTTTIRPDCIKQITNEFSNPN